jgi:hypothetical protein
MHTHTVGCYLTKLRIATRKCCEESKFTRQKLKMKVKQHFKDTLGGKSPLQKNEQCIEYYLQDAIWT